MNCTKKTPALIRAARKLLGAAALLSAMHAVAVPVTFEYAGTLDTAGSGLPAAFTPGAHFSGSFTYESTARPSPGCIDAGCFDDALLAWSFLLGDYALRFEPGSASSARITVADNSFGSDVFSIDAQALVETGSTRSGFVPTASILSLVDNTGAALSSFVSLPTALDLDAFDFRPFYLFFRAPAGVFEVAGTIDSLAPIDHVAHVAEPAPVALLMLAAALVALRRSRRKR